MTDGDLSREATLRAQVLNSCMEAALIARRAASDPSPYAKKPSVGSAASWRTSVTDRAGLQPGNRFATPNPPDGSSP